MRSDSKRHWVTTELHHLFVTAGESGERDLTGLQPEPETQNQFRATFSAAHLLAWMSAINQTRLILAATY